MGIFAKLFEQGGEQVLVTKDTHEETDAPCLTLRFDIGWASFEPKITYKDSDAGTAARDRAFDDYTHEQAFLARGKFMADFGDLTGLVEEA